MRHSLRLVLLSALLVVPSAWAQGWLLEPDDGDADVADALLGDLRAQATGAWWNDAWRFRRRIEIDDPRLTLARNNVLFFSQPSPLLLYNTGRAAEGLRDLRILDAEGTVLPSGTVGFGLDDGNSMIWCRLPARSDGTSLTLTLYYGNPDADELGGEPGAPAPDEGLNVVVHDEKTRPGASPPTYAPGAFFTNLVVVEAEDCSDAFGRALVRNRKKSTPLLYRIERDEASGGAYLASTIPWRPSPLDAPLEAWTDGVRLPEAGTWYVHVRYRNSTYYPVGHPRVGLVVWDFAPFTLILGDREFECGAELSPGADYRWQRLEVDLPEGESRLGFRMPALAGPDCVLFTRDPDYRPDRLDINGPVWMRFKLLGDDAPNYFVDLYCVVQPWTSHGPQGESAGFLLRDRVAATQIDAQQLIEDEANLIRPGDWSPWARTLHSQGIMWWTHARFHPATQRQRLHRLSDGRVAFQFATRPHASRVFREGEETMESAGLHVLMPSSRALAPVLETLSFAQWARRRYRMVEELGLAGGSGPERFFASTMATSWSTEEAEYILKTCGRIGFNGLELRSPMSTEEFWPKAEREGIDAHVAHHWYPKDAPRVLAPFTNLPPEGISCTTFVTNRFAEAAGWTYSPDGARWREDTDRTRLIIMGDEIGPAISSPFINHLPALKGYFHEYLEAQGLTPAFFGKTAWDEIEAGGRHRTFRYDSEAYRALVALVPSAAKEFDEPSLQEDSGLTVENVDEGGSLESELIRDMVDEETRQAAALDDEEGGLDLSAHGKRLYYWTQRFRSHYTTRFYGAAYQEIARVAEAGHFRRHPLASPNFQALPVMRAQMWKGALNLFEWGREGTSNFMMLEDWNWDPYRIAFGMEILRAAARHGGQDVGALLVGGGITQRFIADLGNGARAVLSYLYGPLRVIGPPWADHSETVEAWSRLLAAVGRHEDDLFAATNRPCGAAILVANTSEINLAYRNTAFHRYPLIERAAMFMALMDAQFPVEVVGEEEVMHDGALDRYRALFVSDPHVHSEAQERIREWVENGGVLWSSYAAMTGREYDERSEVFTDVFGVASRPAPADAPVEWEPEAAATITVPVGEWLDAVTFRGVPYRPAYELTSGTALATFSDGTPALVHNTYGRGHAYLFGATAYQLTGGHGRKVGEPPDAAAKRKLISIAAQRAGVQRHVQLSHPRVLWFVHDGPAQSICFLTSCFEAALDGFEVEVYLPRRPQAAVNADGEAIAFDWLDDRARLELDLGFRDGTFIVFRY